VVKFAETAALLKVQRDVFTRIIDDLQQGQIRYNRILNQEQGVVDDILVYKDFENYLGVFNASNVQKDIDFFTAQAVPVELMGLHILAVQGPQAEAVLQPHTEEQLAELRYYNFVATTLADLDVIISRTGYTGEKGFEIMLTPETMPLLWQLLLQEGVTPCGLAARDTLRIEAGMPLYGHELQEEWSSVKSDTVLGLKLLDKGVPRQGYPVLDLQGSVIGQVTSGTFSPTLQEPIAIVLVENGSPEEEVLVQVRNNRLRGVLTKLPFVSKVRSS
jgi:aminomethyltransferase